MATELDVNEPFSLPAAADFSTGGNGIGGVGLQYYCVKINSSGQFALVSAVSDYVVGILSNFPAAGQMARVNTGGIRKVRLGGTVTVGAMASPKADATAVVGATGNATFGIFLDAGVSGDIVRVLIQRGLPTAP